MANNPFPNHDDLSESEFSQVYGNEDSKDSEPLEGYESQIGSLTNRLSNPFRRQSSPPDNYPDSKPSDPLGVFEETVIESEWFQNRLNNQE